MKKKNKRGLGEGFREFRAKGFGFRVRVKVSGLGFRV